MRIAMSSDEIKDLSSRFEHSSIELDMLTSRINELLNTVENAASNSMDNKVAIAKQHVANMQQLSHDLKEINESLEDLARQFDAAENKLFSSFN